MKYLNILNLIIFYRMMKNRHLYELKNEEESILMYKLI